MNAARVRTVLGQPSWSLRSRLVQAAVTRLGGHLAPVAFRLEGGLVARPFAVAPWAGQRLPRGAPGLLHALRGDFFCCPFGANAVSWRGERHPPHGETASRRWRLVSRESSGGRSRLLARLHTRVRAGRVDKLVLLRDDHRVVYSRHDLTGMGGMMSLGHHALLAFPPEGGPGLLSTSAFEHGQVLPRPFESPEEGGYQSLRPGAMFSSLKRVPRLDGTSADLTVYPARPGYDDLVLLAADRRLPLAWSAVTFARPSYVFFALKDPRFLRSTLLWMSNGGRHYPPWNGRHRRVLGIEDATAYFHLGLAESAGPNPLSRRGIATALRLHPGRPTSIRYIIGVAPAPRSFGVVADIRPTAGGIEIRAASGRRLRVPVALDFLGLGGEHR